MKYIKTAVWDQLNEQGILESQITETVELDDTIAEDAPLIDVLIALGPFAALRSDAEKMATEV